jgi:hypothetical protein
VVEAVALVETSDEPPPQAEKSKVAVIDEAAINEFNDKFLIVNPFIL